MAHNRRQKARLTGLPAWFVLTHCSVLKPMRAWALPTSPAMINIKKEMNNAHWFTNSIV